MKALLFLILPNLMWAAEPITLKLEYKDEEKADFPGQIQAAFTKLIVSDANLAKEFAKFEAPPPEEASGRYYGTPIIQPLMIRESESVDFNDAGGKKEFKKTITLYYRFDQGEHRGRFTNSGFFATFAVTGMLTYGPPVKGEHELANSLVEARFLGFSRTLEAPKPDP